MGRREHEVPQLPRSGAVPAFRVSQGLDAVSAPAIRPQCKQGQPSLTLRTNAVYPFFVGEEKGWDANLWACFAAKWGHANARPAHVDAPNHRKLSSPIHIPHTFRFARAPVAPAANLFRGADSRPA